MTSSSGRSSGGKSSGEECARRFRRRQRERHDKAIPRWPGHKAALAPRDDGR